MSSIRPTTSAKAALRVASAIAIGALALAVAVGAGRDLLAEQTRVRGAAALADAERAAKGALRERAIARAETILGQGVALAPDDADMWNLLAEARLVHATNAIASDGRLLGSAAEASVRAGKLAPKDAATSARIALVRALQDDGKAQVDAALAQSYAASEFDPMLGERRLEAAGRAWPALSPHVREEALSEACQLARRGAEERKDIYDLRMGSAADAGMAIELDRIMADRNCAAPS